MYIQDRIVETAFHVPEKFRRRPSAAARNASSRLRVGSSPSMATAALPIRNISAGGVMAHVYSCLEPASA